jgi:predicted dinucleotide-utilizing enzyme
MGELRGKSQRERDAIDAARQLVAEHGALALQYPTVRKYYIPPDHEWSTAMAQVTTDIRLDRIVEGLEPHDLARESAAGTEAAREVIAYAETRGFKVTFASTHAHHEDVLAPRRKTMYSEASADVNVEARTDIAETIR